MFVIYFVVLAALAALAAFAVSRSWRLALGLALVVGPLFGLVDLLGLPAIGWHAASLFQAVCAVALGAGFGSLAVCQRCSEAYAAGELSCGSEEASWQEIHAPLLVTGVGLAVVVIVAIGASSELVRHQAYRALFGPVAKLDLAAAPMPELGHIRLVPEATALLKMKSVFGAAGADLGSRFEVETDSLALQEIDGRMTWVAPLDYRGLRSWLANRAAGVPGYVRVSAEDPAAAAELVTRDKAGRPLALRYTPAARFGQWLDRQVFFAQPTWRRENRTFEVDDAGVPWYIYTLTKPTVFLGGYQVQGVVLADPQTGNLTRYAKGSTPAWVDRVVPENRAYEQASWWGAYDQGRSWFGNLLSGDKGVAQLAAADLWLIKHGERLYWFGGLTSPASSDHSLVGALLVDSRTGQAFTCPLAGFDESKIVSMAEASLGKNKDTWMATQPIPYVLYGTPTWVMPVVAKDSGQLMAVALADMAKGQVALETSLPQALAQYRTLLARGGAATPGATANAARTTGTVVAIGMVTPVAGTIAYHLRLAGVAQEFASDGTTDATADIAYLQRGDTVTVEYLATGERFAPAAKVTLTPARR